MQLLTHTWKQPRQTQFKNPLPHDAHSLMQEKSSLLSFSPSGAPRLTNRRCAQACSARVPSPALPSPHTPLVFPSSDTFTSSMVALDWRVLSDAGRCASSLNLRLVPRLFFIRSFTRRRFSARKVFGCLGNTACADARTRECARNWSACARKMAASGVDVDGDVPMASGVPAAAPAATQGASAAPSPGGGATATRRKVRCSWLWFVSLFVVRRFTVRVVVSAASSTSQDTTTSPTA